MRFEQELQKELSSFENKMSCYEIHRAVNEDDLVIYIINDTVVLAATPYLKPISRTDYGPITYRPCIFWEELSPNISNIAYSIKGVRRFNGLERYYEPPRLSLHEYAAKYPNLRILERYKAWEGIPENIVLVEMDVKNDGKEYQSFVSKLSPRAFMCKVEQQLICDVNIGTIGSPRFRELQKAFNSWKGEKYITRLENHARYYIFKDCFKETHDLFRQSQEIENNARNGLYDNNEATNYIRPINKWKSEELVYKLTKKIYKNDAVIYQHRPFFLRSLNGGQMSYDVYISKKKIAIEYQGKQHFEPIAFFGGEEAFNDLKKRDEQKKELSVKNGVTLVYINYWEEITETLIMEKIENAIRNT